MNGTDQEKMSAAASASYLVSAVLAALALSNEQLTALARQGFVAAEYRGKRGPFFKLRFRCKGRQMVRYLGKDVEAAERVRNAVVQLQAEHQVARQLRRLTNQARAVLRAAKLDLREGVRAAGFDFHGLEIRKKLQYGPSDFDCSASGDCPVGPEEVGLI